MFKFGAKKNEGVIPPEALTDPNGGESATRQKGSMPYLNKAIDLGETDAHYTLAIVYLSRGTKEEAIDNLKAYAKASPNEAEGINRKIAKIKEANIKMKHEAPLSSN
jgi:hypothetical protein